MIDPIIFAFDLFGGHFEVRWYGLIIAIAVVVGTIIADREVIRRGGREGYVWDALIWIIPAGIVGARLGYVLNDIAGGSKYFLDDPMRIIRTTDGGLHIYGALILGYLVGLVYNKRYPHDKWVILDALAPTLLIAQAFGRLANFINQELYGPPTDLPWGIPIAAGNRLAPWNNMSLYPEETTRFHPTFAYEMIWNLLAAGLILWLTYRFVKSIKPGTALFLWLLFEGLGRFFLENFRPDQPRLGTTDISFSRIAAGLIAVIGVILLLVRYEKIRLPFIKLPEKYKVPRKRQFQKKR